MATSMFVSLGKSSLYKGVYIIKHGKEIKYQARNNKFNGHLVSTEREAAIAFDKYLINKGKSPVNILKKQ